MKKYAICLLPMILVASSGNDYDIVPRTINFVIFIAVLCYFLAKPLSNMYKNRISNIAQKLQNIQSKLQDSKIQKELALKKIDEAKISAENLILNAKKESEVLSEKAKKDLEFDIANMEKSFKEQKDYEYRKMIKGTVEQILADSFSQNSENFDKQELVETLIRKVG